MSEAGQARSKTDSSASNGDEVFPEDRYGSEVFIPRFLALTELRRRPFVPLITIWAEVLSLVLLDRSKPKRIRLVPCTTCGVLRLCNRLALINLDNLYGARWFSFPTTESLAQALFWKFPLAHFDYPGSIRCMVLSDHD